MAEREYRVWSKYTIVGEAWVTASSAREAIEKGLNASDSGVEFIFSDPIHETKMRAERWPRPEPDDREEDRPWLSGPSRSSQRSTTPT